MSDELDLGTSDLETPALAGTVKLAQAALSAPEPSPVAESESRLQVEALMQEAALSPKILREAVAGHPRRPLLARLLFWRH